MKNHSLRLEFMNMIHIGVFLLYLLVYKCPHVYSNTVQRQQSDGNGNLTPGLPIAIVFDKNTSTEIQDLVERAMVKINSGIKYGRNKWSVQINVIDMNNNLELLKTICAQMSRGVLAIFGDLKRDSLETIKSYTKNYQIPYITWSFLNRVQEEDNKGAVDFLRSKQRMKRNEQFEYSDHSPTSSSNNDILIQIHNKSVETASGGTGEYYPRPSQIYLRPDISPILIEMIKFYDWADVYYIYNYPQALLNLEHLIEYQNNNANFTNRILIRKITDIYDCRDMLRVIEATNENNAPFLNQIKINMIVDLDSKESYSLFLNQIKDLGMTKTRFHYILATFGIYELDINDFRHGGANIIGFSLVDYHNINTIKLLAEIFQSSEPLNRIANIPNDAALLIDGLAYFSKRVNSMIGLNMSALFGINGVSLRRAEIYVNKSRGINCSYDLKDTKKWPLGRYILDLLKSNEDNQIYDGLTGTLNFDEYGKRKNTTVWIYKVGLNMALTKIGYYSSDKGVRLNERINKFLDKDTKKESKQQKKRIVVTIKDDPFLMIRPNEPDKNYTGNDRYIGYCVDLTKKIADIVNFTYEIKLVSDGRFGSRDANGNWDGIVGELVRNEADIAIAPLTISSQRERAIEFSMPFMNIGISIMIKKPKKEKPGVFSFMAPLDSKIWICVILAYVGVSVVLYLVSRFSPYEWYYDPTKNNHALNNDFTILNTLWFNLAALMQQGVDTAPKSISGRLVASVWWFFTLILISSYTANLAAFLTVERMVSPIESADQLSKQTKIQYGVVDGGATQEFFKNSNDDTYSRMWKHMQSWGPSVFVKSNSEGIQKVRDSKGQYAFLLESSLNEYLNERMPCDTIKVGSDLDSKGYGIATPFKSDLRDPVNLAVLQLREEGFLDELKNTWWYDKGECGTSSSSTKDSSSQSALNLINVAGIFYILIVGLMLSVLVATLELMYKAKLQSENTKIEFKEAVKSKMRLSISAYDDSYLKDSHSQQKFETNNPLIDPYMKNAL